MKVVLVALLSVIEITSFTLRSSLIGIALYYSIEVNFLVVHYHCCDSHTGCDFLVLNIDKFYVGAQAFIYGVFIACFFKTHATPLA